MTYNDVTNRAEPVEVKKTQAPEPEPEKDPESAADDDIPTEEELAVYDTDYMNDDEDSGRKE